MRILVTGANGFLGVGIVDELLKMHHEVIAADFNLSYVNQNAKKVECNIFDIDDPYNYFDSPDSLLHLAWQDGFKHYSDAHINDLPKHMTFLEKMATSEMKSITVMGTMHEIGFFEGSVKEDTPCDPLSYYGIAKNALRNITKLLCTNNNISFKWLRAFYIVSNSPRGASVFSKIAQASIKGQKTFPFTSGDTLYDFLDYGEFCKQVAAATVQDDIHGIINICSGKPERLSERVERFIKDNKLDIKLNYGEFPDRIYDSKAIWGNNEKIFRIMGTKI